MAADREQEISRPLVSVIVPTYNYAHLIEEAIKSVQAQTYRYWECVVVDDGSTDATPEVVASFSATDDRVKYVRQDNQGQSAARNTGLRSSTGAYVQFLDADDLLEPRKLEQHVAYLESHPEVDIVYGAARYFETNGAGKIVDAVENELPWRPWRPGLSGRREVLTALVRTNIMPINAPLVRKRLIATVGDFDETLPQSRAEDWDYWLRCALAGATFQYLSEEDTRALVRLHAGSSNSERALMYRAMLRVRKKLGATISDPELRTANREMAAMDEGHLGIEEVVAGNLFRGLRSLVRATALERKARWRAKWLLCAVSAPFVPRARLRGMVSASLTRPGSGASPARSL